jgi:HSP20 family protein
MKRHILTRSLLSVGLLALMGGAGAKTYMDHAPAHRVADQPAVASPAPGKDTQSWSDDPWMRMYQDMQQIQAHMDRMFEDSFQRFESGPPAASFDSGERVTLDDQKDKYVVTAQIPGAKESDIRVALDGRLLSISSQTQREDRKTAANGQTLSDQRYASSYQQAFTLPEPVSATGMHTEYKDGVLQVIVPKANS